MGLPLANQSTALVILPPAHQPTATLSGPHSLLGAGSRRESALDVGCHQGGAGGGQDLKDLMGRGKKIKRGEVIPIELTYF